MMTTFKRVHGNGLISGICFSLNDIKTPKSCWCYWRLIMLPKTAHSLTGSVLCPVLRLDAGVQTPEPRNCNNNTESQPIRGPGHEPLTNQRPDNGSCDAGGLRYWRRGDAPLTMQPGMRDQGSWAVRADATSTMQRGGLSYKYNLT